MRSIKFQTPYKVVIQILRNFLQERVPKSMNGIFDGCEFSEDYSSIPINGLKTSNLGVIRVWDLNDGKTLLVIIKKREEGTGNDVNKLFRKYKIKPFPILDSLKEIERKQIEQNKVSLFPEILSPNEREYIKAETKLLNYLDTEPRLNVINEDKNLHVPKKKERMDAIKRVAFAFYLLNTPAEQVTIRVSAAKKAHSSITTMNKYENHPLMKKRMKMFSENRDEVIAFRKILANKRKPKK